ncbi:MAG TPA: hypothetical protein VG406_09805 [Isosphaeraceae bacterium]|jgi:hypothetical protein|nr:hypothetical protein [Isosphaeraceae bacterium]
MSTLPKTLRYAEALATAEGRIVKALPEIVDALIARAKDGDTKAAVYLLDRILGRAAGAKAAPADDRAIPYTPEAFALDAGDLERDLRLRRSFAAIGAR